MKTFKRDNKEYIILALNTDNDDFVWKHLDIKPLKELLGCYNHQLERSYLLPMSADVLRIAESFNQESVLELSSMENGKRQGIVRELKTNNILAKGEFKSVGTIKPNNNAYTYDFENNCYYVLE